MLRLLNRLETCTQTYCCYRRPFSRRCQGVVTRSAKALLIVLCFVRRFVNDCRQIGITAPILPGIMPVQSYGGFKRMTGARSARGSCLIPLRSPKGLMREA